MDRIALDTAAKDHLSRPITPSNQNITFTGTPEVLESPTSAQQFSIWPASLVGWLAQPPTSIGRPEDESTVIKLREQRVWAFQITASGVLLEILYEGR
ncbi:hypothetical protein AAL_06324 [Moelleriella libera RCEF 2490]|uniref:Uncharacterized protein n=1 Tax=Moelleriella libera RCEF 2490 TaxID=1081109 RepID=A0A167Z3I7_9HYPO|nr:hypothetical protein AAL_06324 [Moelleriella libera RCEF 2490]